MSRSKKEERLKEAERYPERSMTNDARALFELSRKKLLEQVEEPPKKQSHEPKKGK